MDSKLRNVTVFSSVFAALSEAGHTYDDFMTEEERDIAVELLDGYTDEEVDDALRVILRAHLDLLLKEVRSPGEAKSAD
jgi:hypothetical protein